MVWFMTYLSTKGQTEGTTEERKFCQVGIFLYQKPEHSYNSWISTCSWSLSIVHASMRRKTYVGLQRPNKL